MTGCSCKLCCYVQLCVITGCHSQQSATSHNAPADTDSVCQHDLHM